jgi:hypothetical protein
VSESDRPRGDQIHEKIKAALMFRTTATPEDNKNDECPVCCFTFEKKIIKTNCKHIICIDCIVNIIRTTNVGVGAKCPMCRQPFNLIDEMLQSVAFSSDSAEDEDEMLQSVAFFSDSTEDEDEDDSAEDEDDSAEDEDDL